MAASMKAQEEHSRVFYDYIRSISECRSKQEEDEIIAKDLKILRKTFASPHLDTLTVRESVTRIFYAEMLGHSAEFGHIHCVNLCSSTDLTAKRVGYLSTWLCINPASDLMYLIVANIQKDMKSSNFLEVSAALDAASRLLRPELMYAISDAVGSLLQHSKSLVRRKAVEAMHAFYVKSEGEVGEQRAFRQALTDRDPSVMDAAVRLLYDVVRVRPQSQKDLTDAFLSILSQIVQRRLAREYDYRHVPAPWLQTRLIRMLALIVGDDAMLAQKCEPLFVEAMRRADTGSSIGFAVISEVVAAAAAMPPLQHLLELCEAAIDGCLASRSPNVKYMGIKMLSQMASRFPAIAAQHQHAVMDSLEDPDETIRRRTITLLFAICNEDNIDPIAHRIIKYLSGSSMRAAAVTSDGKPLASSIDDTGGASDAYLKRNITCALCLVAERFAPSASWYIHTMNRILFVAPDCVPQTTVQRMLKLIAEGQDGVEDAANVAFRTDCVETYFAMTGGRAVAVSESDRTDEDSSVLKKRRKRLKLFSPSAVPDVLNRVAAWVMGEYGFLTRRISQTMLMDRLCDMLERADNGFAQSSSTGSGGGTRSSLFESSESETRSWIVTAVMKLAAQAGGSSGDLSDHYADLIRRFKDSRSVGLQQRSYEFLELTKQPALMRRVLPLDGCCEDLRVQSTLPFLNAIVETARQQGARPFDAAKLRATRSATSGLARGGELLPMDAYQHPTTMMMTTADGGDGAFVDFERLQATGASAGASFTLTAASTLRVRHGAKRWGARDLEPPQAHAANAETVASAPLNTSTTQAKPTQAFHSDPASVPNVSVSATGPNPTLAKSQGAGPSRNQKFMKDIFSGEGKVRKSRGIFGQSSSSSTAADAAAVIAPAEQSQLRGHVTEKQAAARVMDDLFAPTASSSGAVNVSLSTRVGAKQWGPAASANALSTGYPSLRPLGEPTASTDGGVSIKTPLIAREATRTVVTVHLSASPTTSSCKLRLSTVAGASWRLLRVSSFPGAAVGSIVNHDGIVLGTLSSTTTAVEVELLVSDSDTFLGAMQTGALVVSVSVVASSAADADFLLSPSPSSSFSPAETPLAQTTLTLRPADILRPVGEDFTTTLFGQLWVKTSGETKAVAHSTSFSFLDSHTLRGVLSRMAALRVVEVIDKEWIAAARALGSIDGNAEPAPLLFHLVIVGPEAANVTVRCPNAALRRAVVDAISSL